MNTIPKSYVLTQALMKAIDDASVRPTTKDKLDALQRELFASATYENAPVDVRTGRPIGDHGTAVQAIDWVLNHGGSNARCEIDTFLKSWMEGDLGEWPEFYQWLASR